MIYPQTQRALEMSTTPGSTKSKSKTFQKGEDFSVMMDWLCENIETLDYKPEGIDQDPQCDLAHRYVITITRFIEPKENEK
jgi:hypothetical protein